MERKKHALIVAGGKGSRMATAVPKQFLPVNAKPVLMHTLSVFHEAGCNIILVLPEEQVSYWNDLCKQHHFVIPHQVAYGGRERFDSVKNGLALIKGDGLVAIHDGVRPCVSPAVIANSFNDAAQFLNGVTAVKPKESIRMQQEETSIAVNRDRYYLVQTPQTFDVKAIKKAYEQAYSMLFTDDASVFEAAGHTIHITAGDYRNIKITTPEDLDLAALFLT
ncbi:MAG: 2-C-methyl-D-erythritol 4-phosphate cytidylyltransferase [Bacteroidota bacterium]